MARGVFGRDEIARLREGYDYIMELASRTDLPEEILKGRRNDVHIHLQTPGPMTGPDAVRFLRKVQWPALIHPAFEEVRNSSRFPALLAPLIGTTLKQFINQINFKMPGGKIEFPWHQDVRPTPAFRDQVNNYVQTIVVVDEATVANGCLHVIPGSHKLGNLRVKRYAKGSVESQVDVSSAVPLRGRAWRRADVHVLHGPRLLAEYDRPAPAILHQRLRPRIRVRRRQMGVSRWEARAHHQRLRPSRDSVRAEYTIAEDIITEEGKTRR